jgi:serine protease inhibitor
MKKMTRFLPFILVILFFAQCSNNVVAPDRQDINRELSTLEKRLVTSGNSFGLDLFKQVNADQAGQNVFISPLSVSMALGMTLNGANAATRDSMAKTLGFAAMSAQDINESYQSLMGLLTQIDPGVTMQIANSIWHRSTFAVEQSFIDVNRLYFNAVVRGLDFTNPTAPTTINTWVQEATNGKIEGIVDPPIPPETMMFLINAVYYKGTWTYEFKKTDTRNAFFTLSGGTQKLVPMMNQSGNHRVASTSTADALDLPYGTDRFSMMILLPPAGVSVEGFVSSLDEAGLALISEGLRGREIDIAVPKFRLEYKNSLKPMLKRMGMSLAFSDFADFSKINPNVPLCITDVKHKTFVEVNEEGTEAAAVTSVEIGVTSIGSSFRVDRPFVFMIRENKSGAILFIGKIVDPS